MKNITYLILTSLLSINLIYAGCGSCKVSKNKAAILDDQNFVTTIAENGAVSGLVQASCGMCNFTMKNQKECNLAIQIGEKSYLVQGTKMAELGDPHAKDGMCNAVRVANVVGNVKDDVFLADSFELQKNQIKTNNTDQSRKTKHPALLLNLGLVVGLMVTVSLLI